MHVQLDLDVDVSVYVVVHVCVHGAFVLNCQKLLDVTKTNHCDDKGVFIDQERRSRK